MASSSPQRAAGAAVAGVLLVAAAALCSCGAMAQLTADYYDCTCPDAYNIVKQVLIEAHKSDVRIYASLTRLHFHDCFVQVRYHGHAACTHQQSAGVYIYNNNLLPPCRISLLYACLQLGLRWLGAPGRRSGGGQLH
jgi:hypothetical protein